MYDISFISPVKNIHDLHTKVSKAYSSAHIPKFYPAANHVIQHRLKKFVDEGLEDKTVSIFDKVNSNRTYQLEKDSFSKVSLLVDIQKGKKTGKYFVLKKKDEIDLVLSTLLHEAKASGALLTAPKCYKRLHQKYDISDKRIRLIISTIYKSINIQRETELKTATAEPD
ncbi:unnamed protein product, partial [Adineta steineri]